MNEREWLASADFSEMVDYLRTKLHLHRSRAGRRKFRLFGSACCHLLLPLLEAEHPGRLLLQGAERHADGLLDKENWKRAERAYYEWFSTLGDRRRATLAIHELAGPNVVEAATDVATMVSRALVEQGERADLVEGWQCEMLRHIFGNPFSPSPARNYPSTPVALARSLYGGEDCAFALHDALEEAGHVDLSEHFRLEQCHPKGCWVVDTLLNE